MSPYSPGRYSIHLAHPDLLHPTGCRCDGCFVAQYSCLLTRDTVAFALLCLSAWNDKFVKIRMTAPKGTMSRTDATAFVQAWIDLLR